MNGREFYDYIVENFTLDGTSSRLIANIIEYVESQGFVDAVDAQAHLRSLLDGAFGIEDHEFRLYRAPECSKCCSGYAPDWNYEEDGDEPLCPKCDNRISVLMDVNSWANRCGYFFNAALSPKNPDDKNFYPGSQPCPNNGYNCRHPEQSEQHNGIGCCFAWSCPLAYEADEEDCEAFGVEHEEGAFVVVKVNADDYDERVMWKKESNFRLYMDKDAGCGIVEFEVKIPGDPYPVTTCVVDSTRLLQGVRTFPCGSGDDYTLTEIEASALKSVFASKLKLL